MRAGFFKQTHVHIHISEPHYSMPNVTYTGMCSSTV